MNRNRFVIALLLLMSMVLAISGCQYTQPYKLSFYEDDARIAQTYDSYSFTDRVGRTVANDLEMQFTSFTGKRTIWLIAAGQDCVLVMDVNNNIEEGKFKVCLISPDREVKTISEGSQSGILDLEVSRGENILSIVGSEAGGEIDMTLRYDNRVSIIPYEHLLR